MMILWIFLTFIGVGAISGAKVILQGTKKLTELIDEIQLHCLFEDTDSTVIQLNILHGKKTIAKLVDVKKVEILNKDLNIHATGLIDLGSSTLNLTIEGQKHGNYAYTCQATIINQKNKTEKINSSPLKITVTKLPLEKLTDYVAHKFKIFEQNMNIDDKKKIVMDHENLVKEIEKLKSTATKKYISGDTKESLVMLKETLVEQNKVDNLKSGTVERSEVDGLKQELTGLKKELENLKDELGKLKSTIADAKVVHENKAQIKKLRQSVAKEKDLDGFQKQLENVQKEVVKIKKSMNDIKKLADLKSDVVRRKELDNFTSIITDLVKLKNLTTITNAVKHLENVTSTMVQEKDFRNIENDLKKLNETMVRLKPSIINDLNNLENLTTIIKDVKKLQQLTSEIVQREEINYLKSNMVVKKETHNFKTELDKLKKTVVEKVELDYLKSSIENDAKNLKNITTSLRKLENSTYDLVRKKDLMTFENNLKRLNETLDQLKSSMVDDFKDLENLKTKINDVKKLENLTSTMVQRKELDYLKANFVDNKKMEQFQEDLEKLKETAATKFELARLQSSIIGDLNELKMLKTIINDVKKIENLTSTMVQRVELESLESYIKQKFEIFEIWLKRLNGTLSELKSDLLSDFKNLKNLTIINNDKNQENLTSIINMVINLENATSAMIQRKELDNLKADLVNKYDLENVKKELKKLKDTTALKVDLDDLRSFMADKNELQRLKSSLDTSIINDATQFSLIHQKFEMMNASTSMTHTIDKGSFDCDNNLDKTDGKGLRYKETVIHFRSPFSKPPTILVGLRSADIKGNIRIVAEYNEVTPLGFIGICGTWYNGFINFARYDWLAFD